jgi:hypothetical protein
MYYGALPVFPDFDHHLLYYLTRDRGMCYTGWGSELDKAVEDIIGAQGLTLNWGLLGIEDFIVIEAPVNNTVLAHEMGHALLHPTDHVSAFGNIVSEFGGKFINSSQRQDMEVPTRWHEKPLPPPMP